MIIKPSLFIGLDKTAYFYKSFQIYVYFKSKLNIAPNLYWHLKQSMANN